MKRVPDAEGLADPVPTPAGIRSASCARVTQTWQVARSDQRALAREFGKRMRGLLHLPDTFTQRQLTALLQDLDQAVALLDCPDALVAHAPGLARSARAAGIPARDYELMVAAFGLAIEARLDARFDAATHAAWLDTSQLLVALLRRAAGTAIVHEPPAAPRASQFSGSDGRPSSRR